MAAMPVRVALRPACMRDDSLPQAMQRAAGISFSCISRTTAVQYLLPWSLEPWLPLQVVHRTCTGSHAWRSQRSHSSSHHGACIGAGITRLCLQMELTVITNSLYLDASSHTQEAPASHPVNWQTGPIAAVPAGSLVALAGTSSGDWKIK